MNFADKQLFDFFKNYQEKYKGQENVISPNMSLLSDTYGYYFNLLYNQEYSDINIQDNEGNTFLHQALKYKLPNNLIELITLNGADTHIVNNHGKKTDDAINVWKEYKMGNADAFINISHTAHPNFMHDLFEHLIKNNEFRLANFHSHITLLKGSKLYSPYYFTKLIFSSTTTEDIKLIHNEYLSMNPTPEDNSLYLSYVIKKGFTHLLHDKEMQDVILNFIENSQFSSEVEAYGDCFNEDFVRKYKNGDIILGKDLKDSITEKLIASIFTSPREQYVYDYCDNVLTADNPALKSLYLYLKLHHNYKEIEYGVATKKNKL